MTLPNKLTLARILMVPVFIAVLLSDFEGSRLLALALFIAASLTDLLDGYIARKYDLITDLGKLMDPVADKVLVTAAMVGLVQMGRVSIWPVMIILTREFLITSFRSLAASKGSVIAASKWGKIKTVTQMFAIMLLMSTNHIAADALLWTAVFFTIVSAADYLKKNRDVLK